MAVTKLIVMYPMPKDMTAFERAYSGEHIPMAAPIFQSAGATKVVLTKMVGAPTGAPARRARGPRATLRTRRRRRRCG